MPPHVLILSVNGSETGAQKGFGNATLFSSFFLSYALAFWYGTKLVSDDLKDDCTEDCVTGVRAAGCPFSVRCSVPLPHTQGCGVTRLVARLAPETSWIVRQSSLAQSRSVSSANSFSSSCVCHDSSLERLSATGGSQNGVFVGREGMPSSWKGRLCDPLSP